ncbi:uncharacterized protein LOC144552853 [Carex rostrata]
MAARFFTCFSGGRSRLRRSSSPDANATADLTAEEQRRLGPVLLELFSSQGCATSPDAEAIATRLTRPDKDSESVSGNLPPVVVLAFHVDYWDYNGWKDPFGSSAWSVRQKAYVEALRLDTLFTPQVVIGGRTECVGTDLDKVVETVRSAPRFTSPAMQVTFQRPTPETLQATFTGKLNMKIEASVDIMVAYYENGLVTDITNGVNNGRVLPNDHVVRRMEKAISVSDLAPKKAISATVQVQLWDGFNPAKTGILLFVQNSALQVLGVQQFKLPETV